MKNKYIKLLLIFTFIQIYIISSIAFALSWKVLPSINEKYDDNIKSSSDNKEDDFITNLMLGLNLNHEGLTYKLDITGHIYQQLFIKHRNLDYNYQDFTINYNKQLSAQSNVVINDTFNHYPEPQDFATMFGGPSGRYAYYLNNFNITYINSLTQSINANLHFSNIAIDSSNQKYLKNSMSNSAGLALDYSLDSSNKIYFYYDYTNKRLKTEKEINSKGYSEFQINDTELGFQHYITKQLYALLKGGIEYIIFPNDATYSPIVTLSIIDDIDRTNMVRITASKRHELAVLSDSVYDSIIFSTQFVRQVSAVFSFSVLAFYEKGKSVSTSFEVTRSILGINTSLRYYLSEQSYIDATYIFKRNEYEVTGSGDGMLRYDRNQIQIGLTSEF